MKKVLIVVLVICALPFVIGYGVPILFGVLFLVLLITRAKNHQTIHVKHDSTSYSMHERIIQIDNAETNKKREFCQYCGSRIRNDTEVCPHCGGHLIK